VPLGVPIAKYPTSNDNLVDTATLKQWKALGIAPSEPCTDAEFIRALRLT